MIGDALIIVGEIGGNDYNYGLLVGKSIEEIKELVPLVISTISSVITVNILSWKVQFLMFCMVWVMRQDLERDVGVGSHGRQNDHGAYGPPNRMLDIVFNAVSNIKPRRIQSFNRMLELAKRVCRTSQQRASRRTQQTPETLPSCYNPIRWLLQRLVTYFPRTGQIRFISTYPFFFG